MNFYYRQPRYFKDFHCIGSECKDTCCKGWTIDWSEDEVEKVKNAPNCSNELKALIDSTFSEKVIIPNKGERYKAAFTKSGYCPLMTEEGLCRVQKELGAEYLSKTCMDYPRRRIFTDTINFRACHLSCSAVTKRLITDEKAMDLVNVAANENEDVKAVCNTPEKLATNPALKFRRELMEFFYEIIGDKKHDIETNIILGALAAQSLSKLADSGRIDRISEAIKQLRTQLHNGAQLKNIENIKPNYYLRLGFLGKVLTNIVGYSAISALNDETGTPNTDLYDKGEKRLDEMFGSDFWLRNIALNLIFEQALPFKFTEKSIYDNYSIYAVIFACFKLNAIATAACGYKINSTLPSGIKITYEGKECISGLAAIISRQLCQNEQRMKMILTALQENGFTSPAYLALLVK